MKNIYLIGVVMIFIMFGCSLHNDSQIKTEKVKYMVTLKKNDIYYKCGDKNNLLDDEGELICSSVYTDGFTFPLP